MNLYPHQKSGVPWLLARDRAGFFDDQGLGKTITALVAADMVARRIVVVAPTVVAYNWADEAHEWTGRKTCVLATGSAALDFTAEVVVTTHGMLLNEDIVAQLLEFAPDVLIGDEIQMLRAADGKKAAAFFDELVPAAPACWVLTGTPMPNWPEDMWRMLSGLWPSEFAEDYDTFRDKYSIQVPASRHRMRTIATRNTTELRDRIKGKFLRRLKKDELDLPPLRHEQITLHADLPQDMINLDGVLDEETIEKLTTASSPESAFAALLDGTDMSSYRRRCGEAKAPLIAELVEQELSCDPNAKRVIFCHHKSVVKILADKLRKFGAVSITGDVGAKARNHRVKAFQSDLSVRVAICQIVAGGTGVTLTASDDIIFAEASFVPGDNAQARDRVYRIGQTKPCRVRFASLEGTVDKIIMRVLRRKTAAIQEVLS